MVKVLEKKCGIVMMKGFVELIGWSVKRWLNGVVFVLVFFICLVNCWIVGFLKMLVVLSVILRLCLIVLYILIISRECLFVLKKLDLRLIEGFGSLSRVF